MSTRIPLWGRGGVVRGVALVDDEDAEFVQQWRWHLNPRSGRAYRTEQFGPGHNVNRRTVYMHRLVVEHATGGEPAGEVDHINRDRLDNRRSNLRVLPISVSRQNMSSHRDARSRFRGVSFDPRWNRWYARAYVDGRSRHVGSFATEEEAAKAAADYRAAHMPFATN